jgi:DnaJ-class molecular chaperone
LKTCPDCNGDDVVDKNTDNERQCLTCGGRGFVPDDDEWTKSYSIRASESVRMRNGRGYGWPKPRSRLGGGRVLAITTTPMLSTLPRPPVTQRQKPLLIS